MIPHRLPTWKHSRTTSNCTRISAALDDCLPPARPQTLGCTFSRVHTALCQIMTESPQCTSPTFITAVHFLLPHWCSLLSLTQECFNSPYGTGFFRTYAERIPGESTQVLSDAAKENKVYLVGGREASVAVWTHIVVVKAFYSTIKGKVPHHCFVVIPPKTFISPWRDKTWCSWVNESRMKRHLANLLLSLVLVFREAGSQSRLGRCEFRLYKWRHSLNIFLFCVLVWMANLYLILIDNNSFYIFVF